MRRLLPITLLALLLTACGQTGPLYLPDSNPSPTGKAQAEAGSAVTKTTEAR